MSRQMSSFLVMVFLTAMPAFSYSQNLSYDIVWKGESIGQLHANRYDSADFNIYTMKSDVSFWFFGTRTIQYDYYTLYKEDTLVKAHTKYIRNGRVRSETAIHLNGNGYDMILDGRQQTIREPLPIVCSVVAMYHNEPENLDTIFSERFGQVLSVWSQGPNHYFIEKPDGRQTEYFFKNGTCEKVVVENFFATFTFERTD